MGFQLHETPLSLLLAAFTPYFTIRIPDNVPHGAAISLLLTRLRSKQVTPFDFLIVCPGAYRGTVL